MVIGLFFIVFLLLLPSYLEAESWSGTGEKWDPYRISNEEQLMELRDNVNGGTDYKGYYFVLENPLDFDDYRDSTGARYDWIPIGSLMSPFSGNFNGNNLAIAHLTFEGGDYAGLFGCLSPSSVVENIILIEENGWSYSCSGGICGLNEGLIRNCSANGAFTDSQIIGGIVGVNLGVVDSCSNYLYLCSNSAVGGIAGFNYGEIRNCTNNQGIDGVLGVGGIVGYNGGFEHVPCNQENHRQGFVSFCVNNARVFGDTYTGGICGRNDGYLMNCGNCAFVKTVFEGGGIAGVNGSLVNSDGYIYNSFNNGSVYAEGGDVGAICATNTEHGFVDNVFNSGQIISAEFDTSNILISSDEGSSDHLYNLRAVSFDSLYLVTIDSILTQLNYWVDTSYSYDFNQWMIKDYMLGLDTRIVIETYEENIRVYERHTTIMVDGVWMASGSSVYTVDGKLVYLNRDKRRYFKKLSPGVYIFDGRRIIVMDI